MTSRQTIQLHCDSKDGQKHNSTMNSNVTFFINPPITINREVENLSFCVNTFEIPISFYLVNDTNNKIRYNYNGAINTVYIDKSNYSGKQLGEMINDLIPTITIVFDKYSFKLSFTATSPFTLYKDSSAFDLMGFYTDTDKVAQYDGQNYKLISDKPVNLSGTKNLVIYTDLALNTITTKGHSNILLKAPINCSFGEIYFYDNYKAEELNLSQNVLTSIQIKIKDDYNNYVDLQGFDWSCSMTFFITKKSNEEIVKANEQIMGLHNNETGK